MSRARTLTREELIRRYSKAAGVDVETVLQRTHGFSNEELRDVTERVEGNLQPRPGKRSRWRAGRTTTIEGLSR